MCYTDIDNEVLIMVKILIVEDDNDINNMIGDLLRLNQIEGISAYSGTEALLLLDEKIDLVLLDLMLPGLSGQEVIKEIKRKKDIPVIILTAVSKMDTKLDLFALGADDYLIKPFDNNELLARIKIQLKHKKVTFISSITTYKDIVLDENKYEVTCNSVKLGLSKIEFKLLKILLENPTRVFTKDILFEMVWNHEDSADDNTLNVHISKIRSKLKKANPKQEYIETVWGIGYKMKE